jgi:thiosulfate/3-mercaptopyruvate sulfurtransferase
VDVGSCTWQLKSLVVSEWLSEHLSDPELRIIDFRWYYDHDTGRGLSGRAAYEAGHIPGAAFVDLEADVTGERPDQGRHPVPDPDQFQRAMRIAGVGRDSVVIIYDDQGGFSAARLWWLLRYFGHEAVAVLDGGLQTWRGAWSSGRDQIAEGDFLAVPNPEMRVDYHQVRRLFAGALLLDARRWERYVGDVEPVDSPAGHIPGARSAHWRGNLEPDHRFKSLDDLRRRFADVGVRDDSGRCLLRLRRERLSQPARPGTGRTGNGPAVSGLLERLVDPRGCADRNR